MADRLVLALRIGVAAVGLTACSVFGGAGGVDGPVIHSGSSTGDGEDAQIIGAVTLEGECLYLADPENPDLRYPVVWPDGVAWQADPAGVVLPNGDVALLGDVVEGGGGYHDADSVLELAGAAGADLAARCTEEPFHEVGIFNTGSDVELVRLPFENPELAGLCEDVTADFGEGEPSPHASEEEAARGFVAENAILEGLRVENGRILFRGERVGRYRVVSRPKDTFAVESAEWCYPE